MMRLFEACRARKLNKKGFTLIEIVIAMAILAVVGTVITGFIVLSTNSFRAGTVQVDLQYDAQQSSNQIKSVIMGANAGVAMVPSDGTSDPYLLIYNYSEDTSGATPTEVYEVIKLVYDVTDKKIYYGEATFGAIVDIDTTFTADEMVAQHVESFNVDTSEVTSSGVALLNMRFAAEDGSFDVNTAVTLRNKVIASANASAVYSGTRVERNRFVRSVRIMNAGTEIPSGSDFEVNRPHSGVGTISFTADVDAYGYGTDVYWTLENATSADTKIGTDGVLKVGADETATTLVLTATSVADNTKSSSVNIQIKWGYSTGFSNLSIISSTPYNATSSTTGGWEVMVIHCDAGYANEANLLPAQKGYVWSVSFPAGITSSDYLLETLPNGDAKLTAYHNTSGKDFTITVTSKAPGVSGGTVSLSLDDHVASLMQPGDYVEATATVNWATHGTAFARNETYNFSADVVGLSNKSYVWEIVELNHEASGISITANNANANLRIDTNLDWNTSYSFKIKLTVSGKNDSTHEDETVTVTSPVVFSVGAVGVTLLEPSKVTMVFDRYSYFILWYRYNFSSTINVKAEFTNIHLPAMNVNVYGEKGKSSASITGNQSMTVSYDVASRKSTVSLKHTATKSGMSDTSDYNGSMATIEFASGSYTRAFSVTLEKQYKY